MKTLDVAWTTEQPSAIDITTANAHPQPPPEAVPANIASSGTSLIVITWSGGVLRQWPVR